MKCGFRYGDTWYPTWAENDILYLPWTDGKPNVSMVTPTGRSRGSTPNTTTGQCFILGDDPAAYEFYGGKDKEGKPVWTNDFEKTKPLLEWDNNMGCVTVTYNPVLKNYIMCVTDGGNTVSRMNTYLLESDRLDGDWKIITYMKEFGTQAYFVNIPSKFIGADGKTMWLLCSGNFSLDQEGKLHPIQPPGGHYGITFQKIQLMGESSGTALDSD